MPTLIGRLLAKMESIDSELGILLPASWTIKEAGSINGHYVLAPVSQPLDGNRYIIIVQDGGSGQYNYGPSLDGESYKLMQADSLQELKDGVQKLIDKFPFEQLKKAKESQDSGGIPDEVDDSTGNSLDPKALHDKDDD